MSGSQRSLFGVLRWAVWSLPGRLIPLLALVELAALASVVIDASFLLPLSVTPMDLWVTLTLGVAGVVHTEASLGVERMRHRVDATPHIDLTSVWTFAAALLLPAWLATVVVLLVYPHLYLRAWRPSGVPPHRVVFSTATVVLAVHAAVLVREQVPAAELFGSVRGLLVAVLALVAYAVVNLVPVVLVIRISVPGTTVARSMGHRDELLLELATLAMGVVVAGVVAALGPAYAALVVPPLVVLHRTVLVRQLEEAASTDGKTGLLNAAAWRLQAGLAVRAARREHGSVAVLLLDLDHFKLVNDNHGHLAGDQVLSEIGATLRDEVRDHDLVGRFGGEEFVILLAGESAEDPLTGAVAVADRIRRRIDDLRPEVESQHGLVVLDDVSVSVGVATYPHDGTELERLLEVADTALYAAKAAGRNSVRHAVQPVDPPDPRGPVVPDRGTIHG